MPNLLEFSPGVDLVTDEVAIVMQDRPLIGMSSWLVDAFAAAGNAGRALQLITPPSTRISHQVRTRLFVGRNSRWVVREHQGSGLYDGLSGLRLAWHGGRFTPGHSGHSDEKPLSSTFLASDQEIRPSLMIEARVRYPALETTLAGRSAELLCHELTGAPPAGWGIEEPVGLNWNLEAMTTYCRNRAPRGTWINFVGSPEDGIRRATGSLEVYSHRSGIEEIVRMAVAWSQKPSEPEAAELAAALATEFDLITLLVMTGSAAPDTSVPARLLDRPTPLGMALGGEALSSLGTENATAVEGLSGQLVGSRTRPAAWYPVVGGEQRDWKKVAALVTRIAAGDRPGGGQR